MRIRKGMKNFDTADWRSATRQSGLSRVKMGIQHHQPQNRSAEFNHAINYVNKVKDRFQEQPERYKQFLEILHSYVQEKKILKKGQSTTSSQPSSIDDKHYTVAEIHNQIAKLFENQQDLLTDFEQFLPDAKNYQNKNGNISTSNDNSSILKDLLMKPSSDTECDKEHREQTEALNMELDKDTKDEIRPYDSFLNQESSHMKRSSTFPLLNQNCSTTNSDLPSVHKVMPCSDVTLAEMRKHASLNNLAFDNIRLSLCSH